MTETTDAQNNMLRRLRERIRDGWEEARLFIEPAIMPGLTPNQVSELRRASADASDSGIAHYIAIIPMQSVSSESQDDWDRFTAEFAYSMYASIEDEHALVIFSDAGTSNRVRAYIVDDNGPTIPPGSVLHQRSKTGDFLPVELAVPYHLGLLIATVKGTEPPELPDFEPLPIGSRNEDYIDAAELDGENPDGLVLIATATAAFGLTVWLLQRRNKYTWRGKLTQDSGLVREHRLTAAVDSALGALPDPIQPNQRKWALYDRGHRVQEAITLIVDAHPEWTDDVDVSHRHAILALVTTDRWVRSQMRGTTSARVRSGEGTEEPRFCFFCPSHTGRIEAFAWKQGKTVLTINVCTECRADLNSGHEPERLMVPKKPDAKNARPVAYYRRDDAYASSGFGSFEALEDSLARLGAPGTRSREKKTARRKTDRTKTGSGRR